MAAAHEHLADSADETPIPFRKAVEALRSPRLRPEIAIDPLPAPTRLAPYAHALEAAVVDPGDADEDLADGRFILLHDPAGHDAWQGTFRVVTLARAELEPEMAADPLLPEVCWSWLTGALESRAVRCAEPSGTVTRAGSYFFGGLAGREPSTRIEMRASWTPVEGPSGVPDISGHLAAWTDLLCQISGLPPVSFDPGARGGVVPLPQRRGSQSR